MTTTASKYLIRPVALPAQPEVLAETDALAILVSATGGAACPMHEVAPLANHLRGPVAGRPPMGHPDYETLDGTGLRSPRDVNDLVRTACGAEIRCTCDGLSEHPLFALVPTVSDGCFVRAQRNDEAHERRLREALLSADVDRAIHEAEPRLEALITLADRARAEHGGDLPEVVLDALVTLARTLVGRIRWDVRGGHGRQDWPVGWRFGITFETADLAMKSDDAFNAVIVRLIEGR